MKTSVFCVLVAVVGLGTVAAAQGQQSLQKDRRGIHPVWHCRDGEFPAPCEEFSWDQGGYTAANYHVDTEAHAMEYCLHSSDYPVNQANGSDDPAGRFDCAPKWYYCRDSETKQCTEFKWADGRGIDAGKLAQTAYGPGLYGVNNDTVANAKDWCMRWPVNLGKNFSDRELDLFGEGTCPEVSPTNAPTEIGTSNLVQQNHRGSLLDKKYVAELTGRSSHTFSGTLQTGQRGRLLRREDDAPQEVEHNSLVLHEFYCYNDGPLDRCTNVSNFSPDKAALACKTKANRQTEQNPYGSNYSEHEVFGVGRCPWPVFYHCREGGPKENCTTFSYNDGNEYRHPDFDGDSFLNARDWCLSWNANKDLVDFDTVFGKGKCPQPPIYHCLAGPKGTCFSFSHGKLGFTVGAGFEKDSLDGAQDYCLNTDVNAKLGLQWSNVTDVFGTGPCPAVATSGKAVLLEMNSRGYMNAGRHGH